MLVTMARPGGPAMLGRLPLGGGATRDVVRSIRDAAWGPNGEDIAIVRIENGRHRLEFPIGRVLYQTGGWISWIRVSPAGDRIAFTDHPLLNDTRGGVSVVDLHGNKTTIADGFEDVGQVAWAPGGQEVWFSAAKGASAIEQSLFAARLNGKTRLLLAGPGNALLQDVSAEGDVLIAHGTRRFAIGFRAAGAAEETELAWMDYSIPKDLSADGRQILFSEQGAGGGAGYAAYLRSTDGAPAVRLGKGDPHSISHDGQWVLAADLATNTLNLLPTGAGQPRPITNHGMTQYPWSGFLPGDRTILFHGTDKAGVNRMYVQDLDGGTPRAVTPDGVTVPLRNTVTPDGKWLAAEAKGAIRLFPIDGGESRPVTGTVRGRCTHPLERGRQCLTCRGVGPPRNARIRGERVDRHAHAAPRPGNARSRRDREHPGGLGVGRRPFVTLHILPRAAGVVCDQGRALARQAQHHGQQAADREDLSDPEQKTPLEQVDAPCGDFGAEIRAHAGDVLPKARFRPGRSARAAQRSPRRGAARSVRCRLRSRRPSLRGERGAATEAVRLWLQGQAVRAGRQGPIRSPWRNTFRPTSRRRCHRRTTKSTRGRALMVHAAEPRNVPDGVVHRIVVVRL